MYIKMCNMIVRSRLIKSLRKPNGEVHEYRENSGCIFICAREFSKEFWRKDKVIVVTVELESGYIKEKLKSGIDFNLFDLNENSKARI